LIKKSTLKGADKYEKNVKNNIFYHKKSVFICVKIINIEISIQLNKESQFKKFE